jgi:hypothetical protein
MTNQVVKFVPLILYKMDNLKSEFADTNLDYRLRVIVYALAGFVYHNFGKNITITEILRTQEMQDLYYKDDPIYKQSKWLSTHQYWRAIDLSLKYFTDSEIEEIAKFLSHFQYGSIGKSTAIIHDIGLGKHLHIQVSSNAYTNII